MDDARNAHRLVRPLKLRLNDATLGEYSYRDKAVKPSICGAFDGDTRALTLDNVLEPPPP